MAEFEEQHDDAAPKGKQWPTYLLNENQRRSLSIMLRRVELAAWQLEEQLTREDTPQLVLTRFIHPPDARQKAALVHLARNVRQEVAELASNLHLEATESDLLRTIMSEFSLLWSDLEDSRPRKLKRYGAINPRAYEVLNPPIGRLIELMLAIDAIARGRYPAHLLGEVDETYPNVGE